MPLIRGEVALNRLHTVGEEEVVERSTFVDCRLMKSDNAFHSVTSINNTLVMMQTMIVALYQRLCHFYIGRLSLLSFSYAAVLN